MSTFDAVNSVFPFLYGVPIVHSYQLETKFLLYWYLPIAAFSFYFTGYIKNALMTYGKAVIIRNYSKSKWILKRFIGMIYALCLFVLFQISIFYLFLSGKHSLPDGEETVKLISIYYLTLVVIFSIQLLLELYVSPQISQLIINIYIVLSVLLTKQLYLTGSSETIYYFFITNYGMGFKTGISSIPQYQTIIIDYWVGIFVLLIFGLIILSFSMRRLKNIDIF
ncbi:hypothetical protein FHR85_002867 [Alkalibacillus almallahensis]|nr:hypothetical protein [Alkalibacillus almallahensis]